MPTHHDYDADGTVRDEMLSAQEDEQLRDGLGRDVRAVWIAWAKEQAAPKPSWLVPYDQLSEPDKEVDRRIGERLFREGLRVSGMNYAGVRRDNTNLRAMLVKCFEHFGREIKRMTLTESGTTGTQAMSLEVAKLLDSITPPNAAPKSE